MSSQNNNQPPHKIFKTTHKSEKLLGGTPKQARKINELEKVQNKAAVDSSIRSRDATSSAIGGTYNLLCEAQTHDNVDEKTFAIEARGSFTIPNHYDNHGEGPQAHNGRDIPYPQAYSGKASSSPTLSRYHSNYYARIPPILNNLQDPRDPRDPRETLPPFQWVLNNIIDNYNNDPNDVSLPPICNNSTHQQIRLHTLEPDYKSEDPKLPFQL